MVDLMLFVMVIASAVSLIVVCPLQTQIKTLRALTEYAHKESLRAYRSGR
jgi:hypothetical protein